MVALPIHQEQPDEKYLRLYRRGLSLWSGHVADEVGIGSAAVYARRPLATVAEANCILGELAPSDQQQMRDYFARSGTRPLVWNFPPADSGLTDLRPVTLFRLTKMPLGLPQTHPQLTILPARAAFAQVKQIAAEMHPESAPEQAAEAEMCHLDDSRVDAIVALLWGDPVGYASVLSVGDAGFVTDLYVSPAHRNKGFGTTLGARVLDICTRSLFPDVLFACSQNDDPASRFIAQMGFAAVATTSQAVLSGDLALR